jgi:hypothetical protein
MENTSDIATTPPSPDSVALKMKNSQFSPFVTQLLDVEKL